MKVLGGSGGRLDQREVKMHSLSLTKAEAATQIITTWVSSKFGPTWEDLTGRESQTPLAQALLVPSWSPSTQALSC